MDRYLKYLCDEIEIKENYIDNEGRYVEYIESSELNKIIENVVSIQKIKDNIKNLEDEKIAIEKSTLEYSNIQELINIIDIKIKLLKDLIGD